MRTFQDKALDQKESLEKSCIACWLECQHWRWSLTTLAIRLVASDSTLTKVYLIDQEFKQQNFWYDWCSTKVSTKNDKLIL